ncbi:MAG TPA: cell division protein SepF [Thermoleophilia bacterium]|nr:cell division protein SepF [Thermoleophilia bacterium]HQG03168.1 cell division protein SepF [Thermoleophilia bacterium]HQG54056.1 cell division protein SepF [Thermoleophilia bacterium]HQJ96982.1 cell division protein SepF [Thermoleophilia bacterium]
MGLGDTWHKVAVYFGIADEEDEVYDEDETLAPHEELERSYQERPNVRKLSASRGRSDYDEIFSDEQVRRPSSRVVRPLEAARATKVEVHLVIPKNFNDAQQVADKFKVDVPVILNLQGADTELAKRLIDFSSGLTYALDGGMQRVADKVFLLTPRNVEVSAEERARLLEKGFFNQF